MAPPVVDPPAAPKATATATPSPVPMVAVGYQEWLDRASAEAMAWNDDAVLTYAYGHNRAPDGGNASIDGRSKEWSYSFTSLKAKKYVFLSYVNGVETNRREVDLWDNVTPSQSMINQYTDLYRQEELKIDCAQATSIACARYKEIKGTDPEGFTSYTLTSGRNLKTGNRYAQWTIRFNANVPGGQTVIKVDAIAGAIIP